MPLESIPPEVLTAAALIFGAIIAYIGGRKHEAAKMVLDLETHIRETLTAAGVPTPAFEQVDIGFTEQAVKEVLPEGVKYNQDVTTIHTDGKYFAVTPDSLDDLRAIGTITKYLPYRPERFDCEDHAELFSTLSTLFGGINAVGTVHDWSAGHSYNLIVQSDGTPILYEPGSDTIVTLDGENYTLEHATIVF